MISTLTPLLSSDTTNGLLSLGLRLIAFTLLLVVLPAMMQQLGVPRLLWVKIPLLILVIVSLIGMIPMIYLQYLRSIGVSYSPELFSLASLANSVILLTMAVALFVIYKHRGG